MLWQDRKRHLGMPISFTQYSFDEERFFIKRGLLKTVEDEVRLYRIMDLRLEQTLSQKLFRVGSIYVNSSDKSQGNFVIQNIKDSRKVKEQLSELVEQNREKKRVVNREMMLETEDDDELN
ncbi:MAG: PH domain-containing protein [Lachnospiraceae bacterium]|jgi:uncharacterized membrane protein YdbT with pleckstrin-like domain|nr:PH domain-containing protein [Lachnospiraceae bacterium]